MVFFNRKKLHVVPGKLTKREVRQDSQSLAKLEINQARQTSKWRRSGELR